MRRLLLLLILAALGCAGVAQAPIPTPDLTYTQQRLVSARTSAPIPTAVRLAPTPTPLPYTALELKQCRKFQIEVDSATQHGWEPTDKDRTRMTDCNKVLQHASFGLIPIPTSIPLFWPTKTPVYWPTPTAVYWPTSTPIVWPSPTPTIGPEWRGLAPSWPQVVPTTTPKPPTPTPAPPTPTPFPVTDGVSPVPHIEAAYKLIAGKVDKDGIPLNERQMASLLMGITDYYALDFERRCLTDRSTHPLFDKALVLDYPGYEFVGSEGPYWRYSGADSFSEGKFSSTRTGDYLLRYLDWYIRHEGYNYWINARINSETCEIVPYLTGAWYNPVRFDYEGSVPGFVRGEYGPPCPYQPLEPKEVSGRREDIATRPTELLNGWAMASITCEKALAGTLYD